MKNILTIMIAAAVCLLASCDSSVNLTTWKNPSATNQITKVVVMPLFEKLEYMKPFEASMVSYFNGKGLKAQGSLEILDPTRKYQLDEIKRRCDSIGADAILVFIYEGVQKSEEYIPPTTYYTGGYGGYWGAGYWGGYYGGYAGTYATTGGYWTTSSTINLTAKLYVKGLQDALWTSEIKVTDPEYVDQAAFEMAGKIYSDWRAQNIIKSTNTK